MVAGMNRDQFIKHLTDGFPATEAVQRITGYKPVIVTIAEGDDGVSYRRYAIMMAGPIMAALVILEINVAMIPDDYMKRIKTGEPCGSVLKGMTRVGFVQDLGMAVRSGARLMWHDNIVGEASEIFTEGLFK
jgi:hypothetical protein